MPQLGHPADAPPLNGWKEIAAYLGRSVRSVQRYERELALPIHRLTHTDGQTVYAFRHEIDAWREKLDLHRPHEDSEPDSGSAAGSMSVHADQISAKPAPVAAPTSYAPWRRWSSRLALGAVGIVLVIAAIGMNQSSRNATARAVPTEFLLAGHFLEARDSAGRAVWKHDFGVDVSGVPAEPGGWTVSDLDADGAAEVVVAVRFAPPGQHTSRSDALFAFARDADGTALWSVTAPDTLTCRTEKFSSPWKIHAMAVSTGPGPQTVWVAFNHHTWWPGLVLEVAPDGRHRLRYAQTGWVRSLAAWTTASGSYLAAGGVNNERDLPTLAVIDLAREPATTPATADRFQCPGLPAAAPAAVFLFEIPETVKARGNTYSDVGRLRATGQDLRVSVHASGGDQIVQVTPDFMVADLSYSDTFWVNHRELERDGKIRHQAGQCPARREQVIQRWMPDAGWQDLKIMPTIRTAEVSSQR